MCVTVLSGEHWEQHRSSIGPATHLHSSSSTGEHHSSYCHHLYTGPLFTDDCYCLLVSEVEEKVHVDCHAPTNGACGYYWVSNAIIYINYRFYGCIAGKLWK